MDITINNVCTFPSSSSNGHEPHSDVISSEGQVSDKDTGHKQQIMKIGVGCNFIASPVNTTNKLQVIIPDDTIIDIKVSILK